MNDIIQLVEGARAFFIANQTAVTYGMSAPLDKAMANIGNGFLHWRQHEND